MEKEEIIKKLEEQYTDKFTIDILTKFLDDFQNSFNNYILTKEVLERLKERVKKIVITNELINQKLDGQYDDENKTLILYNECLENPQYLNYLVFHELLHAITTKDLSNSKRMFGFYDLASKNGNCFNEAMTEWLTKIRNNKEGVYFESGYDAITEQFFHLSRIIGKDKLINTFLYEPENIKNLLLSYNIDFDEIEEIFNMLIQKEPDIKHLGNQQRLDNLNNVNLYKKCERLFDIYSNAIGKVDSAEKFKYKYQLLGYYSNNNLNLNKLMEMHYYTCMYNDLKSAIKNGATSDEINKALENIGVSFKTIKTYNNFNELFSKGKNEVSIELYKLFSEKPNQFYDFTFQNYSYLFNKFSETDLLPNEANLYDMEKYAMIGKFLAGHKNYEYDEISTTKLSTNNNIIIYCFKTSDNKRFLYTLPSYPVELIEKNKFKINYPDGNISFDFRNGISFKSETKRAQPITVNSEYSEYSQLEDIEYCMNSEKFSKAEREEYRKKSEILRKKIQDNRSRMLE